MKGFIRSYFIHVLSLDLAVRLFTGSFTVTGQFYNIFIAGGLLTALDMLIKPILKLLFFPINALTLGLFSIVINSAVFYLFYRLSPFVKISDWTFPGIAYLQINIPAQPLGFWGTLAVIATVVSFLTGIMVYLTKE